jgi:hypothetical protein
LLNSNQQTRTIFDQGYRFVAVGNHLLYKPADEAKYFTDLLLDLIPNVFGREWWETEIAKPRDRRHPVFQWRYKAMTYQNKQPKTADGIYVAHPTGPMFAYYILSASVNGRVLMYRQSGR